MPSCTKRFTPKTPELCRAQKTLVWLHADSSVNSLLLCSSHINVLKDAVRLRAPEPAHNNAALLPEPRPIMKSIHGSHHDEDQDA